MSTSATIQSGHRMRSALAGPLEDQVKEAQRFGATKKASICTLLNETTLQERLTEFAH